MKNIFSYFFYLGSGWDVYDQKSNKNKQQDKEKLNSERIYNSQTMNIAWIYVIFILHNIYVITFT